MPRKLEPRQVTPTLELITIKGKYKIPLTDFEDVSTYLQNTLSLNWAVWQQLGNSIRLVQLADGKEMDKMVKTTRPGMPIDFSVTVIEFCSDGLVVEVQCLPVMYHKIGKGIGTTFTENQVQEAQSECRLFTKQVMSGFKGKEIEPVSVYPIIQRGEIKSRLLNLGLKEIVDGLDKAELHIVQNHFSESMKSSRTAFEKMIDWQMKKRGEEKTNSYTNDLERLRSRGYLDKDTVELLKGYYSCLSNIAVHEKGAPPGIYEAQMGYGMTLIMLDYFANKLP